MAKNSSALIFDNSTYGLVTDGMELEIDSDSYTNLSTYMQRSNLFRQIALTDNSIKYHLWPARSTSSLGVYELKCRKMRGSRKVTYFLNVTANPTKLAVGDNIIPVILEPKRNDTKRTVYIRTVQFLNRLPFVILEKLPPVEYNGQLRSFCFTSNDRKRIDSGCINIARLQLAWYSNSLENRESILSFIRLLYCGLAPRTKVLGSGKRVLVATNIGEHLNINATAWDDNLNVTLVVKYGKDTKYKLVLYAKDEEIQQKADERKTDVNKNLTKRVSKCIRYDATIFSHAWNNKSVLGGEPTLCAFESRLFASLDEDSLDKNFTKGIMKTIMDELKATYLLNLDPDKYYSMVRLVKELARDNKETLGSLAKLWLKGNRGMTVNQVAEVLSVTDRTVRTVTDKFTELTGLDFFVSRIYLDYMFDNTIKAMRTMDEIRKENIPGRNEPLVTRTELIKRRQELREVVKTELSAVGTVKRFKPNVITEKDLYILNIIKRESTVSADNLHIHKLLRGVKAS